MTDAPKRIWEFDRYINGVLMAEGVTVEKQPDIASAMKAAAIIASRGPHGEVPVLIVREGASEHAALILEAEARGMERAAKLLDKRIESLVADHGSHEWDTNVTNLPEWVETATEELEAQAAAIRAAKAAP